MPQHPAQLLLDELATLTASSETRMMNRAAVADLVEKAQAALKTAPLPAARKKKAAVFVPGEDATLQGLTHRIVELTPERAAALLKATVGNRKLRPGHVAWLAEQLRRDEWILTPQAIAVSADGQLLDGHHRLTAIVEVDKPARVLMAEGWDSSIFSSLDCGAVRKTHDRLDPYGYGIADARNQRAFQAIAAYHRQHDKRRVAPTNAELLTDCARFQESLPVLIRVHPKYVSGRYNASVEAAMLWASSTIPVNDLLPFIATLLGKDNNVAAAKALRTTFIAAYEDRPVGSRALSQEQYFEMTCTAITEFLDA